MLEGEVFGNLKGKLHIGTHEVVGHGGGREGGDEQGHGGGHGHVEHEHLDGEEHASQRRAKNARYSTGGTTAQQQLDTTRTDMEEAAHIGADGTTSGGYGCLKTHAAAKGHGDGGGHHGCVHVARGKLTPLTRDGQQHIGDAMADVAFDNVFYKKNGDEQADERSDKDEDVAAAKHEMGIAKSHDVVAHPVHNGFEHHCRNAAQQPYNDT
mgnify:CR=1 FL=1